jgi:hypothetical protein
MRLFACSVLGFLIFASGQVRAADPAILILKSAWKAPAVEAYRKSIHLLNESAQFNPIANAQLRGGIDELDDNHSYGIRLSPKGISEIKRTRELRDLQINLDLKLQKQSLSEALFERYNALIMARFLNQDVEVLASLENAMERNHRVSARSTRSENGDVKNLIKSQLDVETISNEKIYRQAELEELKSQLLRYDSNASYDKINLNTIVSSEEIQTLMETTLPKNITPLELDVHNQESEFESKHLEYEVARNSRWLDYVGFEIKESPKDQKYVVEMGINLPFLSGEDYKITEKKRQTLLLQNLAAAESNKINNEFELLRAKLKGLLAVLKQSAIIQKRTESADYKRIQLLALKQDPMLAISIEKSILERRRKQIELERDARLAYLEYLHASGIIAEQPNRNYLDAKLSELQP